MDKSSFELLLTYSAISSAKEASKLRCPGICTLVLRAGDKKRLKEARLAKTPKHFFHDYGATCRTRFQGKEGWRSVSR